MADQVFDNLEDIQGGAYGELPEGMVAVSDTVDPLWGEFGSEWQG